MKKNLYADTAIVVNGIFFHYCHSIKGFIALRIHHTECQFCLQKNPDYIPNKLVHTVVNISRRENVMIFADINKAIQYIQDHPFDNLALGDCGYVEVNDIL